jgi:hypothetical protein
MSVAGRVRKKKGALPLQRDQLSREMNHKTKNAKADALIFPASLSD